MTTHLRRYFLAGLLFWIPLGVTVLTIRFVFQLLEKGIALLPYRYQPEQLFGISIPGLDFIIVLFIVYLTGLLLANFMGRKLVAFWESLLARIPVVRSIYSAVKQIMDTLFNPDSHAFRKVLLVQYPREGCWSLAFQTGHGTSKINQQAGEETTTVFVPTTPNPTSGFLVMLPKSQIIDLDMSVDDALKMIISLGVIQPNMDNNSKTLQANP